MEVINTEKLGTVNEQMDVNEMNSPDTVAKQETDNATSVVNSKRFEVGTFSHSAGFSLPFVFLHITLSIFFL